MRLTIAVLVVVGSISATANAHYHILMPAKHSIKAGEKVAVVYQFGHPFEHQIFDAEPPTRAVVISPTGKAKDVLAELEKIEVPGDGGKKVRAFRFTFQPVERGDYTILFQAPPIWMEDEKHFLKDTAQVVIHVEAQKGWDRRHGDARDFAIVPVTRPYGLRAGMVFQVQAGHQAPAPAHLVEFERYNAVAPTALPPDEHITLTVKTDPNGIATSTLPDPGWWAVTAVRQGFVDQRGPTKQRDGKTYPMVERATLWVYVEDKVAAKPAE